MGFITNISNTVALLPSSPCPPTMYTHRPPFTPHRGPPYPTNTRAPLRPPGRVPTFSPRALPAPRLYGRRRHNSYATRGVMLTASL